MASEKKQFFQKFFIEPIWFWIAFVFYLLFINVCVDWTGLLVDEGFVSYGARRVLDGEIPHKDFFFLWTPGILYLHAFIQKYISTSLLWGRAAQVPFTAFIVYAVVYYARNWKLSSFFQIAIGCLALLFGNNFWNTPYASWHAISLGLAACIFLQKRNYFLAGAFFALSFWFKQNIGLLALVGAMFSAAFFHNWGGIKKIIFAFLVFIFPGFIYFYLHAAFSTFFKQVFLFPLTYREVMAISPQLWHVLLLLIFPIFIFMVIRNKENPLRENLIQYGFISLGMFLQIYPRFDYQHVLFSFPLVLPPVFYFMSQVQNKIFRQAFSVSTVAVLIFALFLQKDLIQAKFFPENNWYGLKSIGITANRNSRLLEVEKVLKEDLRVKPNDPILILPHEELLYYVWGFKNATPHNQFLPQYVEFYGDKQADIVPHYRRSGGKYIVTGYLPILEGTEVYEQLVRDYKILKRFPMRHFDFAVWEAKN